MLAMPPVCSANCAIGSARSIVRPSEPVTAYLYGVREPMPAHDASPHAGVERLEWQAPDPSR